MHNPELERDKFDAIEAPRHRSRTIESGFFLLLNNPAVRDALSEQETATTLESQNSVTPVDFQNHYIVSMSEKQDLAADARQQIEDIAA